MSVNLNQKQILSIAVVAIIVISLVVLKTVPLKTVTEDYGSQTFVVRYSSYDYSSTTFIAKKGWTVSGSYSASDNVQISFYIMQNKTTVYEKTGASSGSFSFVADIDGSYIVKMMYNQYISGKSSITVTLQAKQTGMTTFI